MGNGKIASMAAVIARLMCVLLREAADATVTGLCHPVIFVLLGAPYVPPKASVEWTVRSAQYAARLGAGVVSIVPVRGGNGELERLAALGHFTPPTLTELELALAACMGWEKTVVTADLWDAERLPGCAGCHEMRVDRLRRLNLTGRNEPLIRCELCAEPQRNSLPPFQ